MFKNYLKTAFRNLLREKVTTFINLAGLTVGITCSLVLFLIITYHQSFDTFHTKRDRIFRVVNESDGYQGKDYQPGVPSVLPDAFRLDFPEAEEVAFTSYRSTTLVTIPQRDGSLKKFQEEEGVVFTEPSFLKIFDWQVIEGDGLKTLASPHQAVISQGLATKYFGKDGVLGKVIRHEHVDYTIGAVVHDVASNSDFPFTLMLSYATIKSEREKQGWNSIWSDEQCYFLLKENHDIQSLQARLPAFSTKHLGSDDFDKTQFLFQPLSTLHFDERFDNYSYSTIPQSMLMAFAVIAIILIVTACINFINLSTAEAIKRSKEIGVRKVLGSSRMQLVFQFIGETTLITMLAMLLSLALTQLVLGFINPFLKLDLHLDFHSNNLLFIFVGIVTVVVSLLSGFYPALVVSGYKPALALKNQVNNRNSGGYILRKGLVVLQFSISQVFIIGTIVIIQQMNFFHQKDLGYNKDAVLVFPIPNDGSERDNNLSKSRTLREEVGRIVGIDQASLGSAPPSSGNVSKTIFKIKGDDKDYFTQVKRVDGNYLDVYKLRLVEGRNLADIDTANGYVVNEEFVRITGFKSTSDILGKEISMWGKTFPIVGVVKDFHTVDLRSPIEPTVLLNGTRGYNTLAVKVNVRQVDAIVNEVRTKWEAAYPEHLFEYEFLDESIREFYEGEGRMATLLSVFTGMAIFIGCLGLFGLATFMANQKKKEIGVRKVLGASVGSIVFMFIKEYGKLIAIGFLVAAPLAGYAMQQFLNEFAYKIEMGPWIYITGLALTIVVAIVTVGFKSFKAAVVNPVKSLRYE